VNRRLWSGALGKLQWTAPVVTGMQAELSSGYAPLHDVCDVQGKMGDPADWGKRARIQLRPEHIDALGRASKLYDDPELCRRRFYYDPETNTSAFWKGEVEDSHAYMDEHSRTRCIAMVHTGDAAKAAAGVWWEHPREIENFPEHERPPHTSLPTFVSYARR
jgi:hypothetical protein